MYPTEEQLKYIKEFDTTKKSVIELLDYIEPIWEYGDWGFHRTLHKLELHTGGWSGNKDIIEALKQNFLFWAMYWLMARRGGHYYFNDRMVSKELKGFIHRTRIIKSPAKPRPDSLSLEAIKEAVKKAPPRRKRVSFLARRGEQPPKRVSFTIKLRD